MRVLLSSYSAFRRVRILIIGVLAGSLLLLPALRPSISQALGTIAATQNISNTSDNSEAPQIAVGGGRLVSIWGERSGNTIGYGTTTPGATWPAASFNGTGTKVQYQWPDVVADSAGTLHMVYAVGDQVFHRSKPASGSLSSAHTIAGSAFPNPVRLAIAPNGTLWAIWRDTDGTSILYKRSTDGPTWSNGSDGGVVASESGNMFSPDVAVGADNIPHVVWYIRASGSGKGEIRVADWNGTKFDKSNVTTDGSDGNCCYDADPAIAVDAQNVQHAVWRKQLNGSGTQWAITYARRPAGQAWQNFTPIATTNANAGYPPAIAVDATGNLFVTYSDPAPTGNLRPRRVLLFSKLAGTTSWDGPLPLSTGSWDSRSAVAALGGIAHVLLQHEAGNDDGEIIYNRVQFAPTEPPVDAIPALDGGAAATRNSLVTVSFTGVTGNPDSVRYHWDAAPTDADSWVTFANPITVPAPSGISAAACETHTLYTQVKKGTTQGSARNDGEIFDIGVQAQVQASNPHLAGLPAFSSLQAQDVFSPQINDGASDGDPTYTRERSFYLGINGQIDCSNLDNFHIPGSDSDPTPHPITGNIYSGPAALPQGSDPANKSISVDVRDKLGNTKTTTFTLTYDPVNTDTTGNFTDTKGLPVLDPAGTFTPDTGNSIIRDLQFQAISVTDNLYGRKEQLPAGKQFWGVWIANTTSPTVTADSTNLNWYPVRVPSPNSTFTVKWNLFTGLGLTGDLRNKTGTYYIFVRVLDGAGNPSKVALKSQVTLTAGYTIPTVHVALAMK